MKRNDSSSINNRATKNPRTLSDVRITRPGPFDIICGRGRPYQEHHGNKRLHEIAAVYKPGYFRSKRNEKKGIAEMIVNSIKNDETQPGRFLKRTDDDENDEGWEEVSLTDATAKVSHVLRFKSTRSSPQPQTEISTSDGGASGSIPPWMKNNQSSMQGVPSNLATRQHTLEPRQHSPAERSWNTTNSRPSPTFGLPVAAGGSYASEVLLQPSQHSTLNVQRAAALLNHQRPAASDFGLLSRATGGTAISEMSSGTVGTTGAPTNVSDTQSINLLSNEQVFLLEALIQRRRRERASS